MPIFSFASAIASDGALLFQCDGYSPLPPPVGGTVVVAIQRVYLVINHCTLKRVSDNVSVPTVSMPIWPDGIAMRPSSISGCRTDIAPS